jgi:hypothetical protein
MDVYIEGNRSSAESWMLAQNASKDLLPPLSDAQKAVADKLHIDHDAYARNVYAADLGRKELRAKAERAARVIERMAQIKVPGVVVGTVWLKTFAGKFRFELDLDRKHATILMNEDVIDELLESGSRMAEEQIARIVEYNLPTDWVAKAS